LIFRRDDHDQVAKQRPRRRLLRLRQESGRKLREELANLAQLEGGASEPESEEQRNKFLVLRLYEALNGRDHAAVHSLLAPDLEWWFHGPPAHQHMMRVLTGGASSFRFAPRTVEAFGSTVIAEGASAAGEGKAAYWVHAWTVGSDGVITQLREYFNTDLTVTRLAAAAASKCVWQSRRPDSARNSLPGLVLAL
jgi:ketosteroid isomerase-like protein